MNKKNATGVVVPVGSDRFQSPRTVFGGMRIDFKVTPSETNGNLLVLENTNERKGGPARHIHHAQEEWFYILEGEYLIQIGEENHRLGPGSSILAPRKIPHVWAHIGAGRGRLLVTFQPAGQMEAFFANAAKMKGKPTPEAMQELFHLHGMELLGPPLPIEQPM